MIFKTMKPEDVRKAIDGHGNVIGPAYEELKAFFKRISCVSCGGEVMPIQSTIKPFKSNGVLQNYLAKCLTCGVEFDPYTRIQVTL